MSSGKFTNADHNQIDKFLNKVLERFKDGRLTQGETTSLLAEFIAQVDKDNYGGARYWLHNPEGILDQD
ncbi:hypothetical protein ACYX79_00625 [Stenotrophomonas rhizophila]